MSRPEPNVILEQQDDRDNVWQLLQGEETYLITYKGQPVSIRVRPASLGENTKKYKRMSYTELGSCIAQVRRYNSKFNTTDFDYIKVFDSLKLNQI